MSFRLTVLFALMLTSLLAGCSTAPKLASEPLPKSTFLKDTQFLTPYVTKEEGARVWIYRPGNTALTTYTSLLLDPVFLKPNSGKDVSAETLARTKSRLDASLGALLKQQPKFRLADRPGPGTARISFAITGAEISSDPLQPWNFLPIGLVLSGITYSTGTNSKTPALLVEAKITDSQTHQLLAEGVIVVQGDSFRTVAGSEEVFAAMSDKVVRIVAETTAR